MNISKNQGGVNIGNDIEPIKRDKSKAQKFEIPDSLKQAVSKLPTPEAIKVIEDIGKAAWIVDNNNNNNKGKLTQSELAQKVPSLSSEQIKKVLDILGPEGN